MLKVAVASPACHCVKGAVPDAARLGLQRIPPSVLRMHLKRVEKRCHRLQDLIRSNRTLEASAGPRVEASSGGDGRRL